MYLKVIGKYKIQTQSSSVSQRRFNPRVSSIKINIGGYNVLANIQSVVGILYDFGRTLTI